MILELLHWKSVIKYQEKVHKPKQIEDKISKNKNILLGSTLTDIKLPKAKKLIFNGHPSKLISTKNLILLSTQPHLQSRSKLSKQVSLIKVSIQFHWPCLESTQKLLHLLNKGLQ